jgi:hypothetical protein
VPERSSLEHTPDVGGLNSTCLNTLLTLQHEASLGNKETRLF